MSTKLVYGVGINDIGVPVTKGVDGKRQNMPSYVCWKDILKRCYDDKEKSRYPGYAECRINPCWLRFSIFNEWYERQNKNPGDQIDKDFLVEGNKIYGPETCIFISHKLNKFITSRSRHRGKFMIGVSWDQTSRRYKASCSNPITGKQETIGRFSTEMEAHLAWKARKYEIACKLAEKEKDIRVVNVLRKKYKDTNNEAV